MTKVGHYATDSYLCNFLYIRAMKQINLADWTQIGEGGIGKVYRNNTDPTMMLKLSKYTGKEDMLEEYELSRYAMEAGLSTPKVYDFVTDGANHYGYTGELIKGKKSLCRIIADDPARLEEMAHLFTQNVKKLHSIKADPAKVGSRMELNIENLRKIKYLKPETLEGIIAELRQIPETATLLHGDLHLGNLITTGEKQYWIDLGRLRYGNPIVDISQFHFTFTYLPVVCKHIFHISAGQVKAFYDAFVTEYYGPDRQQEYEELLHRAELIQLTGILLKAPLAVWFIPKLQRHLGLKSTPRLKIICKFICGQKEIF